MRALQFATATTDLASQNAFLFLATHGPIFIAPSSSATLVQGPVWIPLFFTIAYTNWEISKENCPGPEEIWIARFVLIANFRDRTGTP